MLTSKWTNIQSKLTNIVCNFRNISIDFFSFRPQTTAEVLAKLKPVFKQDGVVTAGSASGIADGAAAVVLASEQAVKEDNLKPLARLVAYSAVGVPPEIMGIGPVPAIQNILKKTGLTLDDIDLVEVNNTKNFMEKNFLIEETKKIMLSTD